MPFTFSHPAIVLPLTYLPKRWVSLTGLVVGSVTPDFEYFIRMKMQSTYSHTYAGVFWFDLPLGILLAFLFHGIARNSLIENLPKILKERLWVFREFDWTEHFKKNWLIVSVCMLIGAASHLFWDGFTHGTGYFVQIIPGMKEKEMLLGTSITRYRILQHTSTVVGGIIILLAIRRLPANKFVNTNIRLTFWVFLIVLSILIVVLRSLTGYNEEIVGHLIVTGISAVLISLVLVPLLMKKIIPHPHEKT